MRRLGARKVHKYVGLTVGVYILVMGLTGIGLNFGKFLQRFNRSVPVPKAGLPHFPAPLTVDQALQLAEAASGHKDWLGLFRVNGNSGTHTLRVLYSDQHTQVLVNLDTGEVEGTTVFDFHRWVLQLHRGLLFGKQFYWLSVIAGAALIVLAPTGFVLGWFKKRRIKRRKGTPFGTLDDVSAVQSRKVFCLENNDDQEEE